MLVSFKWLSQYVDISGITPHELAEKITRAGVEVETVHQRNKGIKNVVIGHVLDKKQHPNADKLSICRVDIGEEEPVQIICGAPNVGQGQKVPVAKVGAVLPDQFKIKKAKLRGELSQGMICSAQEIGIDDRLIAPEHKEGIMVLPEQALVGTDAMEYLELDDNILELDLTPNRSDCLSMLGVAYEVGAILEREVIHPTIQIRENGETISDQVSVEIEAEEECPHYVARLVKGVSIGPSPLWLQNRLIAAGIRPINNVVDVTNFVMLEYGQPLHAFDARRVHDKHIIVRQAKEGESVVTLDDQERSLKEGMLVITDPQQIIAVAGVMGAANSEVTHDTTDIILESAYFSGASVRSTSRDLGLRTEASVRFEKGVDPERIYDAAHRAASLLADLAGGTVVQGVAEKIISPSQRQEISLNLVHLNKVLGTSLSTTEVTNIFDRLAFDYDNRGHEICVDVPTRRPDLNIEEDLLEEVARLYGYDLVPTTLPTGVTTPGSRTEKQELRGAIKNFLQGAGLDQVVTYTLTSKSNTQVENVFQRNVKPISLSMPMSEERKYLRTTIIPNLLEVLSYNKNRKQENRHIFEMGHIFITEDVALHSLPEEKEMIAGLLTGLYASHPWQKVEVPVDFFVVKGIVEGIFEKLDLHDVRFEAATLQGYHPGRTALITSEGAVLGYVGQVHPQIQQELNLEPAYAFELSVDQLMKKLPDEISYESLPKYPPVERDLAIVVDNEVLAGDLSATILKVGSPLLRKVRVFDVYEGDRMAEGKKSVAFSLLYQDPHKTLMDEDVAQVHDKIIEELGIKWKAELRK